MPKSQQFPVTTTTVAPVHVISIVSDRQVPVIVTQPVGKSVGQGSGGVGATGATGPAGAIGAIGATGATGATGLLELRGLLELLELRGLLDLLPTKPQTTSSLARHRDRQPHLRFDL